MDGMSNETIQHIRDIFNTNIKGFYDSEKTKSTDLFDLNKKYIIMIIGYINNSIPRAETIQQKKGNIQDKQIESYTHKDIQNDKRTQFEKDLTIKQQEFTSAITLTVPPVPKFNDKIDEPISEMGDAIRKMTEQRKYDIEQINKTYDKPDSWLQSKDTSIKGDKLNKNTNELKYIKIDTENVINDDKKDVIDLNTNSKKHISWSQPEITNEGIGGDIFKKLKFIKTTEPSVELNETIQEDFAGQIRKTDLLQRDVDTLKNKMEIMNENIVEILTLLKTKST